MIRLMVATRIKWMALIDFIGYFRASMKEGYNRFMVVPITKSDKVLVRCWRVRPKTG